jgi:oxygen-independent coproporphyrinogen-3 oxidase
MSQQTSPQLSTALYIHIPFCNSICPYCAFYKLPWTREGELKFLDGITKECAYYKETAPGLTATSIFIGGGTPSALSQDIMNTLLDTLHKSFIIPEGIEKTCEMNPETITQSTLAPLKEFGFNRISMGVQSFNQTELTYLGRTHSNQTVFNAVSEITTAGFSNWNLDLIFATAPSTLTSLETTLNTAITLNPTHISAYSLSIESGTAFEKRNIPWPEDDADKAQYDYLISKLDSAGYLQYEVSNFAKPGFECQHNMTYWKLENYIGLGPSAVSYCNGLHYQNPRDLTQYLANPTPPIPQSPEPHIDQINDALTSQLRLRNGLNIKEFNTRFNLNLCDEKHKEITQMQTENLLEQSPTHLKTTLKGQLVLDSILERLIY